MPRKAKAEKEKPVEEKEKEKIEEFEQKEQEEPKEKLKEKPKEKKAKDKAKKAEEEMLVPLDEYVKSGIYLGTKVITASMKPYVFKRRADGLAIINTKQINEKLRFALSLLSQYGPEQIIITGKREACWKALNAFSKSTGIGVFTKKYPAGIITNPSLPGFFEPSLVMVVDPWLDKNPMADALLTNIPVIGLCDTNNLTSNIDLVVPCNNKSNKSVGLVFWILAREYIKAKKLKTSLPDLKEFVGE